MCFGGKVIGLDTSHLRFKDYKRYNAISIEEFVLIKERPADSSSKPKMLKARGIEYMYPEYCVNIQVVGDIVPYQTLVKLGEGDKK